MKKDLRIALAAAGLWLAAETTTLWVVMRGAAQGKDPGPSPGEIEVRFIGDQRPEVRVAGSELALTPTGPGAWRCVVSRAVPDLEVRNRSEPSALGPRLPRKEGD